MKRVIRKIYVSRTTFICRILGNLIVSRVFAQSTKMNTALSVLIMKCRVGDISNPRQKFHLFISQTNITDSGISVIVCRSKTEISVCREMNFSPKTNHVETITPGLKAQRRRFSRRKTIPSVTYYLLYCRKNNL